MADQTKPLRRRWLFAPFAVVGVILLGYYFLWRAGAAEMKAAAQSWVEDQRVAGLGVSHGAMKASGFPFLLRIEIDAPDIAAPDVWRWRGERLFLDASPYDLNRLILSPKGRQILYTDENGEWRVRAANIRASIARDKSRDWTFAMTIDRAEAIRADDETRVSVGALVLDLAPEADDSATLTLNLAAEGVETFSNGREYGPGDIRIAMSLSHTDWLASPEPASQWRAAGGSLSIKGLSAEYKGATLSLAGVLNLDAANYPFGRLEAEIANPASFAELLGLAGALSPEEAEAAAAGLTLMSFAAGGTLSAPIDLQNGAAQIAGIKVAELPRIE